MRRDRSTVLATSAVAAMLAIGSMLLLTPSQTFAIESSGAGGVRPPPMIRPPVTTMVPVVPEEVFRDAAGRSSGTPEMAPPIDIGTLVMDLGELAPLNITRVVETTKAGSRKVTYINADGEVVGVVYTFPNNEIYANDPANEGARPHLQDARVAGNLANTAWVVKIGADVTLVILGGPASAAGGALKTGAVSAIYEGAKAGGHTGSVKYQEGATSGEIFVEAATDFAVDATVSAAMDVVFLGAGNDVRAGINEAQAAIDSGTEAVRRGREVLSHLPHKGKVPKTSARKVLNQARAAGVPNIARRKVSGRTIRAETKIFVNRARRQIAEGGRDLAHSQAVEHVVGFAKEGATNATQALAGDTLGRGEAGN